MTHGGCSACSTFSESPQLAWHLTGLPKLKRYDAASRANSSWAVQRSVDLEHPSGSEYTGRKVSKCPSCCEFIGTCSAFVCPSFPNCTGHNVFVHSSSFECTWRTIFKRPMGPSALRAVFVMPQWLWVPLAQCFRGIWSVEEPKLDPKALAPKYKYVHRYTKWY